MANFTRNFTAGRMNKTFDERVVPDGEYIDAMNVRMGSTEKSEAGVIENTNGNLPLTDILYLGNPLSEYARCIGAIEDSARETIYWFVHDPQCQSSNTGLLDLIVSYNTTTQVLTYHVISVDDGSGVYTTLNFNPQYLITGVNLIEDLLFFTDDYNPPRFINIKRGYANPNLSGVDYGGQPDILKEALLVIKKPPTTSPTLKLIKLSGQENFLEDRFICFAYRYRYADGEYTATSQWTEPAFFPKAFQFSEDSFLNEGMENQYNGVEVYFNTGGPLVVGIDLLFKEASSNVIKVIEKFDKQVVGWLDNTTQYITFSSSKIYTILPESELLRLYDNVPRYAKAQTIMGNRLMYGNYVDGYDMIDSNGFPVNLDYTTELVVEGLSGLELPTTFSNGIYNINGYTTINNSVLNIDFSGVILNKDAVISINGTLEGVFTGGGPVPYYSNTIFNFSFKLPQTYTSVYQMATSTEFQNAIGTALNIKPVYNPTPGGDNSCDGFTLTDIINCNTSNTAGAIYFKYESGINLPAQPIYITASTTSNIISLQFVATKYVQDLNSPLINYIYVYHQLLYGTASIQNEYTKKSLHSNRDYEIGIVYMDEFNRATPANVSSLNAVHIPCGNSKYANSITVTIPPSQIAPYWAKRYKFVCKADQAGYETIYSNIFFTTAANQTYFLLQGENARKVQEGDRFIVKADTNGPLQSCVYATVLQKQSYASGDIQTSPDNPAGVYMQIKAEGFSVDPDPQSIISLGTKSDTSYSSGASPILYYSVSLPDPLSPGQYIPYDVPAGSVIVFDIKFIREGYGNNPCETRKYTLQKTYVSSSSYSSMYDWFIGDNISTTINDGIQDVGAGQCPVNNIFYTGTSTPILSGSLCNNYWRFYIGAGNELFLGLSGTWACGSNNKQKSTVSVNIIVYRAVNNIIFETEPLDTLPDVFFENELSFPIDANGNHLSNGAVNDVNQDIALGISGVIQTGFFNCFTFGNGAESYKIRDSIIGRDFNLGNRVTTVAAQDYREERRFADITYSGVYNPETNVNKLNEFNQALLNYKNLELSFGAIYILDGRETDVLVLQEDKVSYVLAGKNLLSDAAAGGAITSVPEVLGTQIARTEKYGISFNPESYVQWGYDRFFTDAKRGAVLQLKGNAYSNEQLTVISEQNMRTWFRDTFIETFNTQKLGGFDPYMNEYVLTINDIDLPKEIECTKCGTEQVFTFAQGEGIETKYDYCINAGTAIGKVFVEWNVGSIDPGSQFEVVAEYDYNVYSSGPQTSAGSFDFFKGLAIPSNINMSIIVTGNVVLSMNVRCPEQEPMTLIEVVWTNNSDAGQSLMKQFNYINPPYISPLQSNFFIFSAGTGNPLVSYYLATSGFEGNGYLPVSGSTMTLQTNETFPYVTFNFNPLVHKFRYARTNVLYGNNDIDMQALLAASTIATPINNPSTDIYNASFAVPSSTSGPYLYIIWDLRESYETQLCYADVLDTGIYPLCCNCTPCEEPCSYYTFMNPLTATQDAVIFFPLGNCFDPFPDEFTITLGPGESTSYCLFNVEDKYNVLQGEPVIYMQNCFCFF